MAELQVPTCCGLPVCVWVQTGVQLVDLELVVLAVE